MSWMFRQAIRENVGLFIGLAGGTGSGKTWSAMEIAKGIVGPGNRFAVIDTENKRASHYADYFDFDVVDFSAPFSSKRYAEVVKYAYDQKYKAIILDSFTHEHDNEGGYLDLQATKLMEMVKRSLAKNPGKSEYEIAEKLTPLSWKEPKADRMRMLQTLLACSATVPLVFCIRAQEKSFFSKDGKLVARPKPEFVPVCGGGMMFEMTASFMLYAENPGVPRPIKLQEQHKNLFPLDKPLSAESGKLIAEWAEGGVKKKEGIDTATGEIVDPGVSQEAEGSLTKITLSPFETCYELADEQTQKLLMSYVGQFITKGATEEAILTKANKNIEGFKAKFNEWVNS